MREVQQRERGQTGRSQTDYSLLRKIAIIHVPQSLLFVVINKDVYGGHSNSPGCPEIHTVDQ
ncbi:hypothetical protein STEG23_013501, partial [Scotinomys teguina]